MKRLRDLVDQRLRRVQSMSPREHVQWARKSANEQGLPAADKPPCATCAGQGWIGPDDQSEWCPDCGGGGYDRPRAHACERCQGTGYIGYTVGMDEPRFGKAYPCPNCRASRPVEDLMSRALVPRAYRRWTLDSFEAHCGGFGGVGAGQLPAYLAACTLAESPGRFREQNGRAGLFLCGPRGVGKTGIAIGVLAALARYGSARFVSFPQLLHDIRQTFGNDAAVTQAQIVDQLARYDLLVVDEFRSRESLPWHGEVAWELLDARYRAALEGRVTIVTAKGGPEAVEREFGDARGAEIASRLEGCCSVIGLTGADLRREAA
ncbi:MAG TPA: hypothetical protein DCQ64_23825 [Candidatus Rokubacteria bacterium]|nr:hypothetical protein [Candidatus Rokubacteria bacterium]